MRLFVWIADLLYNLAAALGRFTARRRRGPVYVVLELSGPYPERRRRRPWWAPAVPDSIEDVRRRLDAVRATPWVSGVVLTVRDLTAGPAAVQALRGALADYRAAGGRVAAYLPIASTLVYYLASAADTIIMPESATLDLVGLTAQATFLGEALRRAGITGEFESIGAYKGAAEVLTRDSMSPQMREAVGGVLDSIFEDVVSAIAEGRRLDPARVRALIDRAPLSAAAARSGGLVDAIGFEDELPAMLRREGGRHPGLVPWGEARRRLCRPYRWRTARGAIALVSVRGAIQMGESRGPSPVPLPFLGREAAGHATVSRALRAAERSRRFRAVILSVDSPGGSALASDLIWREVQRVGARKPVVAFFENVAGSGGYYVAAAARRIVSRPATITGSIGVVAGKVNIAGLADRAGVRREMLLRGEASAIASPFARLTAEERRRVRALAEECYQRFVLRVAQGRGLPQETVLAAAQGRIWTGRQAQRLGLVDAVGGFPAAVAEAKRLIGEPSSAPMPVIAVRAPRSLGVPSLGAGVPRAAAAVPAPLAERVLALMPSEIRVG